MRCSLFFLWQEIYFLSWKIYFLWEEVDYCVDDDEILLLFRAKLFTGKLGSHEISNILPPWLTMTTSFIQSRYSPWLTKIRRSAPTQVFPEAMMPLVSAQYVSYLHQVLHSCHVPRRWKTCLNSNNTYLTGIAVQRSTVVNTSPSHWWMGPHHYACL